MEETKEIQVVQYKVWRIRWRPETEGTDGLGQLIKSYGQSKAMDFIFLSGDKCVVTGFCECTMMEFAF